MNPRDGPDTGHGAHITPAENSSVLLRQYKGEHKWIMHSPPINAVTHPASVRQPPMISIAACTVGTRQVGVRRTVVAVTLIACDLVRRLAR